MPKLQLVIRAFISVIIAFFVLFNQWVFKSPKTLWQSFIFSVIHSIWYAIAKLYVLILLIMYPCFFIYNLNLCFDILYNLFLLNLENVPFKIMLKKFLIRYIFFLLFYCLNFKHILVVFKQKRCVFKQRFASKHIFTLFHSKQCGFCIKNWESNF